jgi:3-deoxy-D-manno-octulosonic-acid transferase
VEAHGLWRVLVVPHEVNESHLKQLISALQLPYEFYTNWKDTRQETDILVLNTLGLLSKTYRYADAAWIGGAFKTGLHNTLEAAVYGIPVGFGPRYDKFQEAKDLLRIGVACSFPGKTTVWEFFQNSTELEEEKQRIDETAGLYFDSQKGASDVILRFITHEIYTGSSSD